MLKPRLQSILSSVNIRFLLVSLVTGAIGCSSTRPIALPPAPDFTRIIVAEIGDSSISLKEFQEQYNRTAAFDQATPLDTLASYEDFLTRYVEFKLKVLDAKTAGYDRLPELQTEIQGYRDQLARPYLLEEEVTTPLIQQIHARRNEMVEASHILIRISPGASPQDTLAAYHRIQAIADSVVAGTDFGDLAVRYSEDPSAKSLPGNAGSRGYLGFFGGGRMVDEFEDAAYTTPVGRVSEIIRTQFGYHILAVHDRRSLPGDIQIAHIMIQPKGSTEADSSAAVERIRLVQQKLADGEEFGEMAREYSDDRGSAEAGGMLQRIAFDAGLPATMRDAAYALEPGQISGIIETPYGFHIVKVLQRFEKESYDAAYDRLISQVGQMPRAQRAEEAFARKNRIALGGRVDTSLVQSLMALGTDSLRSLIRNDSWLAPQRTHAIAWLADSVYTLVQFATYFQGLTFPGITELEPQLWTGLDRFLDARAMEIEIASLERNDQKFARTMQEFRDGLMLFRLMEDSVWSAASLDSVAVKSFYEPKANSYRFPDRTRILSVLSSSDSLLSTLSDRVRSGSDFTASVGGLLADSLQYVRLDTTMVDGPTDSVFDAVFALEPGQVSDPISYERGYLLIYHGGIEPARAKTFKEARPQVVNEYQDVLEKTLVERLRLKYGVVTYPERLSDLLHRSANVQTK